MGMAPELRAQLYLDRRARAINLFTHYPVLDIKIKQGKNPDPVNSNPP